MARVGNRLLLIDVYRRAPRPPGPQRGDQRAWLDQRCPAGVDQQRRRLHAREIVCSNDMTGLIDEPHVQRDDVALLEEDSLTVRKCETVLERTFA